MSSEVGGRALIGAWALNGTNTIDQEQFVLRLSTNCAMRKPCNCLKIGMSNKSPKDLGLASSDNLILPGHPASLLSRH